MVSYNAFRQLSRGFQFPISVAYFSVDATAEIVNFICTAENTVNVGVVHTKVLHYLVEGLSYYFETKRNCDAISLMCVKWDNGYRFKAIESIM